MEPHPIPGLPAGYALQRFRVSRRNRIACAWRSACAVGAALYTHLARRVAGH